MYLFLLIYLFSYPFSFLMLFCDLVPLGHQDQFLDLCCLPHILMTLASHFLLKTVPIIKLTRDSTGFKASLS